MSCGITFGSIGDLIAVSQIAFALAKALNDCRGSKSEYQGLAKDLRAFDQALMQVVALWQNYEASPELNSLGATAKEAIQECYDDLVKFRDKFDTKYGTSLGPSGSRNWLIDTGKKILWIKEKEEVAEFRRKIEASNQKIILLTLAAVGTSTKLEQTKQAQRIQAVLCLLQDATEVANKGSEEPLSIGDRLDAQAETSRMLLDGFKAGFATFMYGLLNGLHKTVLAQQSMPAGLETCWKQPPVTLEDALGDIVPVPLELVTSWEMFHIVIGAHFANRRGRDKVLRQEYAIQDHSTGKILTEEEHWKASVRPGQKLNMSMTVQWNQPPLTCKKCNTSSKEHTEIDLCCENPSCQIWYRRLSTWDSDDGTPGYELYHDEAKVTENEEPGITTGRDVTAQKRPSRQVGVILDTRRPQCFRVVERYTVCRCLYYVHAIQRCSGACGPGGMCRVQEKCILVGYLCPQHMRNM